MISGLIEYISEFVQLENEETEAITSSIEIKKFNRGEILIKEGMISQTSYFNLEGCVRMYYLINGEEKTTFFYTENKFITSMRSFTDRVPSDHYLECVEKCVLALLPYHVEKELLNKYPKFETFARIVLEKELGNYQEMLSTYIISNPEQRYINLLRTNPQLLQRIPQYQLASYIGIKPESLSRLGNRLAKRIS